jgi:pyridoxine/pyridoxamine 5'-phosphate oxidase
MKTAYLMDFIAKHRLGVLSTVSPGSAPESALVGIAVTDRLELVFDTLETTRKSENLRKNPKIAFVIGWDEKNERTLQIEGVADEPKGAELARLKEVYFSVYPDGREREKWAGITYFRVRPTWARYSDFQAQPEPIIVEFSKSELNV